MWSSFRPIGHKSRCAGLRFLPRGLNLILYMRSILELVRTYFAACGGEAVPQRKIGKAEVPHC